MVNAMWVYNTVHIGKMAKELFSPWKYPIIKCTENKIHRNRSSSKRREPTPFRPFLLGMREICQQTLQLSIDSLRHSMNHFFFCHTISVLCVCFILIMSTISFQFFIRFVHTLKHIYRRKCIILIFRLPFIPCVIRLVALT